MSYARRTCVVCHNEFAPPHRSSFLDTDGNSKTHCAGCRRVVKAAVEGETSSELPVLHSAAPLRQVVFDLETLGLDRGWGVTMVASFLFHGDGPSTKRTITLREFPAWKAGRRSDDREMVEEVFRLLKGNHIAYAHNGEYFDIRWLRTVALKYGLDMPKLKLIDPAAIGRQKYLLGRNSLEAMADFLELPQQKYHIPPQVWRAALLNDDDGAWRELVVRCESDVDILNAVASAVTKDVGMVDYQGSWR